MKTFLSLLRGAVFATLALVVICCGLYPLLVWGVAQLCFPAQANGSLIVSSDGAIRGSRLLGQPFAAAKYFHPRPSCAGNGYDAANSGGSNLGPTSKKLADTVAQNVADYRAQNGMPTTAPVPADAVTASGSGLDPHITVANARLQCARVAKARGWTLESVQVLLGNFTEPPQLGLLGEPRVNVLELNRALDAQR